MANQTPSKKPAKTPLTAPTIELISPTGVTTVAAGDTVTVVVKVTLPGSPFTVTGSLSDGDLSSVLMPAPLEPESSYYSVSATLPDPQTSYTITVTATETSSGDSNSVSAYFQTS